MNIPRYFARYVWACVAVEDQLWRATFATENEEEFDLYVVLGAAQQGAIGSSNENEEASQWVHFIVSPVTPRPLRACRERLYGVLLRLNQQLPLAHFGVDEAGDVSLLAALPARGFNYHHFATTLDVLVQVIHWSARDLRRLASEVNYYSTLV
jgi:hypothetical protein